MGIPAPWNELALVLKSNGGHVLTHHIWKPSILLHHYHLLILHLHCIVVHALEVGSGVIEAETLLVVVHVGPPILGLVLLHFAILLRQQSLLLFSRELLFARDNFGFIGCLRLCVIVVVLVGFLCIYVLGSVSRGSINPDNDLTSCSAKGSAASAGCSTDSTTFVSSSVDVVPLAGAFSASPAVAFSF